MTALLFLALLAQVEATDPFADAPPVEWLQNHTPYGMDITLDGKVWINTNKTGAENDFAILANDLHRALTSESIEPKVWIRGYHRRNPKVSYRETKLLVTINCRWDTLQVERRIFYSASKEAIATEGPFASDPIVPGSIGETWRKAACPKPAK